MRPCPSTPELEKQSVLSFCYNKHVYQVLWKGIRVTILFDLLTCIMQCCYIQCMIIQCLIFLLQFQFDFITFHFFFLQSCFRAFDICPSSMQDFHCAMRYAILRSTIIHTPSCHHCFVYANCNYSSRWRFTRRWSLKVVVRFRVRVGEKPSWEFKLLIISLFVHEFLPNLEVFILVRVEVCHKLWILPNSQNTG